MTIKEFAQTVKEVVGFNGSLAVDKTKPDGSMRKLMDAERPNMLFTIRLLV